MANEKKYELTSESVTNELGHTMYRIKALRDFTLISGEAVCAGDFGGYIESEENLSHEGSCWVGENSMVFGDTPLQNTESSAKNNGTPRMIENAYIKGSTVSENVVIGGNAFVLNSHLCGNVKVCGDACIIDSMLGGNADISGNAFILGEAKVIGDLTVKDSDRVYGGKYENAVRSDSEFDLVLNSKMIKIYKDTDNTFKVNYAKNEFAVSEIENYSSDSALGKLAAKSTAMDLPVIPKKEFALIADRAVKNMEVFN